MMRRLRAPDRWIAGSRRVQKTPGGSKRTRPTCSAMPSTPAHLELDVLRLRPASAAARRSSAAAEHRTPPPTRQSGSRPGGASTAARTSPDGTAVPRRYRTGPRRGDRDSGIVSPSHQCPPPVAQPTPSAAPAAPALSAPSRRRTGTAERRQTREPSPPPPASEKHPPSDAKPRRDRRAGGARRGVDPGWTGARHRLLRPHRFGR